MATRDAVIISTARTPIGRAYKGAFNATPGATLGALSLAPAIERAAIAGRLSRPFPAGPQTTGPGSRRRQRPQPADHGPGSDGRAAAGECHARAAGVPNTAADPR